MPTDTLLPYPVETDSGAVDEEVEDPLALPVALVHGTSEGIVKTFERVKSAHCVEV